MTDFRRKDDPYFEGDKDDIEEIINSKKDDIEKLKESVQERCKYVHKNFLLSTFLLPLTGVFFSLLILSYDYESEIGWLGLLFSMFALPFFAYEISSLYVGYQSKKTLKNYLDNGLHISPITIEEVRDMFKLFVFGRKTIMKIPGWQKTLSPYPFSKLTYFFAGRQIRVEDPIYMKGNIIISGIETALKELIKEGTLKGEYDRIRDCYIPPSVKTFKEDMDHRGYIQYEGEWVKKEEKEKREKERKRKERWLRKKEIELGLKNNFADYDPYEFEEKIAELFEKMGFKVRTTSSSGDYGIDVVAEREEDKVVIQVKKYSSSNFVGPNPVQRTIGAIPMEDADRAIFITTSSYTKSAKRVEEKCDEIELWDGETLKRKFREYYLNS